jgi:hypothetical protein
VQNGGEDFTRLFLEHGVDMTVKNKDGLTALYLHDLVHRTWLRKVGERAGLGTKPRISGPRDAPTPQIHTSARHPSIVYLVSHRLRLLHVPTPSLYQGSLIWLVSIAALVVRLGFGKSHRQFRRTMLFIGRFPHFRSVRVSLSLFSSPIFP